MVDNTGRKHELKAYGIDEISTDSVVLDLDGVKSVFPGAPRDVYDRPDGPIDILIGSSYRNLQPFGGDGSCKEAHKSGECVSGVRVSKGDCFQHL